MTNTNQTKAPRVTIITTQYGQFFGRTPGPNVVGNWQFAFGAVDAERVQVYSGASSYKDSVKLAKALAAARGISTVYLCVRGR